MDGLEKVVVSQAVEICDLREKLADALSTKELWYGLYTDLKEKEPADAGTSTDE